MPLSLPALATLLALLWYVVTSFQVGRMRVRYKVMAPATTGHPEFERAFRVQMNEIEQLIAFLPAMWIFAWFGNPRWAAMACGVFIIGRILFAVGYWAAPEKRSIGFTIAFITMALTWLAAMVSVIRWLDFA